MRRFWLAFLAVVVALMWSFHHGLVVCAPRSAGPTGGPATALVGTWLRKDDDELGGLLWFSSAGRARSARVVEWIPGVFTIDTRGESIPWSVEPNGALSVGRYRLSLAYWSVSEQALTLDFFHGEHTDRYQRVVCVGE